MRPSLFLVGSLLLISITNTQGLFPNSQITATTDMPNVIFMIGDGMGPDIVKAASMVEYGNLNGSIMDNWEYQSKYITDSAGDKLTDSAAGGTALATGQLTKNGRIDMDEDGTYSIKNLREYLTVDFGYASGIVTTTEVSHATPAVFSAHTRDRDMKEQILSQQLGSDLKVLLGGGLSVSYIGGVGAAEKIGKDNGFDVATYTTEMKELAKTSDHLFGVFEKYNIPYELERQPETSPSLIEMSQAALDVLTRQDKPFFLEIEGGRIDHAGHEIDIPSSNKTVRGIMETLVFEKSVRMMYDFAVNDGNTIIVVSADHETGDFHYLDFTEDGVLPNENNTKSENDVIRVNRIHNLESTYSSTSHTKTPVRFSGYGFSTTYEIKRTPDVFWAVVKELGSFPVVQHLAVIDDTGSAVKVQVDYRDLDTSTDSLTFTMKSTLSGDEVSYEITPQSQVDVSFAQSFEIKSNDTLEFKVTLKDGNTSISSLPIVYTPLNNGSSSTTETPLSVIFIILGLPVVLKWKRRSRRKKQMPIFIDRK